MKVKKLYHLLRLKSLRVQSAPAFDKRFANIIPTAKNEKSAIFLITSQDQGPFDRPRCRVDPDRRVEPFGKRSGLLSNHRRRSETGAWKYQCPQQKLMQTAGAALVILP
jgi:hypothetical protein